MKTKTTLLKNLVGLFLLFSIFQFTSCSRNQDEEAIEEINKDQRLIGSWKYEESTGISFNTIFLLKFNADGSGSEIIISKQLSSGQQTIDSNTPFSWGTNSSTGELRFQLSGNEQKTSYSFFVPNTQLIIQSYPTTSPHFVKQ